MRGDCATQSQSIRPQREIRVPERAVQSEQKLQKHRRNNEKKERLVALAARRARAEHESQGLNNGQDGRRQKPASQPVTSRRASRQARSNSVSDTSQWDIGDATNAGTAAEPHDEILEELERDEARAKEIIEWFKTNRGIDVSTLDLRNSRTSLASKVQELRFLRITNHILMSKLTDNHRVREIGEVLNSTIQAANTLDEAEEALDDGTVRNNHNQSKPPHDCPRRSEWTGHTLELVDRTAADAKAFLISVGYMKSYEEREEIILQAWERSNLHYKSKYRYQRITCRQIKYIQNLFSPCRKLMKTRLEGGVAATYHLCDGTPQRELPTTQMQNELGEILYFKHPFIEKALALLVFRGPKDLGVAFNVYFNPIPPEMIVFVCAMTSSVNIAQNLPQESSTPANRKPGCIGRSSNEFARWMHAIRDDISDDPDDVLPVDAFNAAPPAERYVPRYKPNDVQRALKKGRVFSDDENDSALEDFEQNEEESYKEPEVGFGQPGPGPATLAHRNRLSRHCEYEDDSATHGPGSDLGSEAGFCPSKWGKGIACIQDSEEESGRDEYYD
ncbi:hypothetical protein FRC09_001739 [Ceratobasidium sp. 395]|nr:hypothetical protein FRC09_001739 [Ceratobasidium sp. 395]